MAIYNLLGQKVYSTKGTIAEINQGLNQVGTQLTAGTYFIELKGKDGAAFHKEIVKW